MGKATDTENDEERGDIIKVEMRWSNKMNVKYEQKEGLVCDWKTLYLYILVVGEMSLMHYSISNLSNNL